MLEAWRSKLPVVAVSGLALAGAACSFYIGGSRLLACGRDLAGHEIYVWLAFAAFQSALFLLASHRAWSQRLYRLTQYAAGMAAAFVAVQLALAYPRAFVVIAVAAGTYWPLRALHRRHSEPEPPLRPTWIAIAFETVLFLLTAATIHTAIAFLVLERPGLVLSNGRFWTIAGVAAFIASWLVARDSRKAPVTIVDLPPFALLAMVLMRTKLPDLAYDSLFYKATLPITVADWRTAVTGVIDHSLLGSDFFEILNAQLRIVDPQYSPALTSAFAFGALWFVVPFGARTVVGDLPGAATQLGRNACCLLVASLTEPLLAAGTAYQEPTLSLLLAAALLPIAPAWLFLAAAIAGKFTAIFIAPIIVLLKLLRPQPQPGADSRSRFIVADLTGAARAWLGSVRNITVAGLLCIVFAGFIVGEQFERNLAYSGRLLGVSEILARWTDPHNEILARQGESVFDAVSKRGPEEKYGRTLVHVLTLDRWIVPDELGFHVMPTSRLIGVAVPLAIAVFLLPGLRRESLPLLLLTWVACAVALMSFFSQGRHLFPLSFGAALLVGRAVAVAGHHAGRNAMGAATLLALSVAIYAVGDQTVGSFINNGWECRRNLLSPVQVANYDQPESPIEKTLSSVASDYRARHPERTGIAPSIVCEAPTERMHYVGAHYVYAYASTQFTERAIAARPQLAELLPTSVLAFCFKNPAFFESLVPPPERSQYREVGRVEGTHILVSVPLMDGAPPTTLIAASRAAEPPVRNLIDAWAHGRLNDYGHVDTPNGRGALVMQVDGQPVGVLLSPYRISFANVDYQPGDALALEMAMPYAISDGMAIEVSMKDARDHEVKQRYDLLPKAANGSPLSWERREIPVPADFTGLGTLTISASSPSGNPIADWAYFRKAELHH